MRMCSSQDQPFHGSVIDDLIDVTRSRHDLKMPTKANPKQCRGPFAMIEVPEVPRQPVWTLRYSDFVPRKV
jgi:hypothetical protein